MAIGQVAIHMENMNANLTSYHSTIFKVIYIQKFKNYIKALLRENIRENVPTLGLDKYFLVHKSTKLEKKLNYISLR